MPDLIIDPNYLPSLDQNPIDYFNRALNFAQTNYQPQLKILNNLLFYKLVPTIFFDKYCSCVCDLNINFGPYLYYFNFHSPISEPVLESLSVIEQSAQKQAIHQTSKIINSGMKLYGWKKYRDNFLATSQKLQVLPLVDCSKSLQLGQGLGLMDCFYYDPLLIDAAKRWHFDTTELMLREIGKHFVLQQKIIAQILLYSLKTFETA